MLKLISRLSYFPTTKRSRAAGFLGCKISKKLTTTRNRPPSTISRKKIARKFSKTSAAADFVYLFRIRWPGEEIKTNHFVDDDSTKKNHSK